VRVHGQLSFGGQTLQRLLFQVTAFIFAEIVQKGPFKNKEAAVDIFVQDRFFFPGKYPEGRARSYPDHSIHPLRMSDTDFRNV